MTNLNDGVGKKIVEALKKQTEMENGDIEEVHQSESEVLNLDMESFDSIADSEALSSAEEHGGDLISSAMEEFSSSYTDLSEKKDDIKEFINKQDSVQEVDTMPGNIVILKKLISQLPSGVTRHTGAQIIKQTMEALGISMKSVLTEAQEVQNHLKVSSKECQMTIQELKQKIIALEKQTQNYQKQYSALNDLISLFIQTTK